MLTDVAVDIGMMDLHLQYLTFNAVKNRKQFIFMYILNDVGTGH